MRQALGHRARTLAVAGSLVGALAAAGCASTAKTATTGVGSPAPSVTVGVAQPATQYVTESDNGHTFRVASGTEVLLLLYSSYWDVPQVSAAKVLEPLTTAPIRPAVVPSVVPSAEVCGSHTVAGSGCGVFEYEYRALATGSVQITTHRTSCGEAMMCGPSKRSFSVSIEVNPGS